MISILQQILRYLWEVLWGWQGLALAVLGANEVSEWLFHRSLKKLHEKRWTVAVSLLLIAQAIAYHDLTARQLPSATGTQGLGVIAENPDHAGLVEKLDRSNEKLAIIEKKLEAETAALQKAKHRIAELEAKLAAVTQQQTRCEQLANLSASGRRLVNKLFATRAAPETRREIDRWYEAVCAAMSKTQCEAFLGAPVKSDNWLNYPAEDGGYSQTLRGRTQHLAGQLSVLCR